MDQTPKPITQISFTLPADLRIQANARKVLQLRFEHPEWSQVRIGEEVGLSSQRVNTILNHPRVVAAFPHIARQRIQGMVPKAIKAYESLVDQDANLQVKEKAAAKVLGESKVFDAPTIRVEGEITLRSVRELEQIVQKAYVTPQDVVDAEVIPPETPSV